MKNKLIVIEGPDRVGKDTLLDACQNIENLYILKQHNEPPHYRNDPKKFEEWLNIFLKNQIQEIIALNQNIIMARLFGSDAVYSEIFNRRTIIYELYHQLKEHYDYQQIIIIYNSYQHYLERCKITNSEIEYSESEFNRIQKLFRQNKFTELVKTTIVSTNQFSTQEIKGLVRGMIK